MSTQDYIYRIQPKRLEMLLDGPTEKEGTILQEHVSYLTGLAEAGKVLLAGRTQTLDAQAFGLVILRVASEAEAIELMENDPAIKFGLMKTEIFPYSIAVLSDDISK